MQERVAVHLGVIRELMLSQGWLDASSFARSAGVGQSTMRRVVRGESRVIRLDVAQRIASGLGVDWTIIAQLIDSMWVMGPNGPIPLARCIAQGEAS